MRIAEVLDRLGLFVDDRTSAVDRWLERKFAKAAAFLAFDATYSTGIELAVDGGETQL